MFDLTFIPHLKERAFPFRKSVKCSSPRKELFSFYGEGYFAEGNRPWELDIAPNSYTFIVKKWTVRKNLSKSKVSMTIHFIFSLAVIVFASLFYVSNHRHCTSSCLFQQQTLHYFVRKRSNKTARIITAPLITSCQ